ncbi:MAG: transcriptional repressor [Lachnospiraceae bacterium]|nr:transcriptional repressor [Lachnospiraceae bacterium]
MAGSRSKYNTKQREVLLEYLKSVSGRHVTAADVCAYLKEHGTAIGQATVYRRLESLVDEGIVNKYIIDANSPACFEYVDSDSHAKGEICFHCKCVECGRLLHLHCDELAAITGHLYEEHSFRLDPKRTVFYGSCEKCMK